MRIAEVIGTVTLSRWHASLNNSRWVIGVPFSLSALRNGAAADGEDLVIYDNLGAGAGHRIGFSEGAEAAQPFVPERKPIDAFCACLLDQVVVNG
jgi:microcompartment protein CcmK/EutM